MEHQIEANLDSVLTPLSNNSESDSKLLDIKIEIGSDIEEKINIAENIKNVIATSLGNEKDLEERSGLQGSSGNTLEAVSSKESVDNVVDTQVDLLSKTSLKRENNLEDDEVYEGASESLTEDVLKVPEDSYNIEINDSTIIPSSDISLSSVVELEELTTDNSEKVDLEQHQDEKMGLLTKAMTRIKNLPFPGSDICKGFSKILSLYSDFLSPAILSEMSPAKCGLCYEEFTSERYTWKHYTGNNHKVMMEKLINGRYQEYCPSYFTMVMEAVYSAHPNHVTERQILEIIKSKFGEVLGQDDKRKMALIRTKGLDKLIQSEYIMREPDDLFSVTEHLVHRKRRIKKMLENYQRNVTDKDVSDEKDDRIKKEKLLNQDPSQFRQQIIDLSRNDLPPEIVDTLLLGRCGLCKLEIFCKPWSHYTGPGHRTMVDIYKEGGYLGHPPYPTMIDSYIKQEKPDNLVEEDVIEFLKKNFNVGEDAEKVQKRVEMALATISRKKCKNLVLKRVDDALDAKSQKKFTNPERESPSNHLVWFKKSNDKSEDKVDIKTTLPAEQDSVTKTWSNDNSLTRGRGHGNSYLSRDRGFSSQNSNYKKDPQPDQWDNKEKKVTAWKRRSEDYSRVNQYEINKREDNYRDIDVRRKGEKGNLKREFGEEKSKFLNGDDKCNGDRNNKMVFHYNTHDHREKDSKPRKDYADPSEMPVNNMYVLQEKKKRKSSPISHHSKSDRDRSKFSKTDSDAKLSVKYESHMKRSSGPNEHYRSSQYDREVRPSDRTQSEIHVKSRRGSVEKRLNGFKDRRHGGSEDARLSGSHNRRDGDSKERRRSGSQVRRRSGSQVGRRSGSQFGRQSGSQIGRRSRSQVGRRSGSQDERRSVSRDRKRGGSRYRRSESRDGRNSESRDGRNSGSRDERNSGSRDERNSGSRDERNGESRDRRKSGSHDRRKVIGSKERRQSGSKVKRLSSSQSSKSPLLDIIPEKNDNRGSLPSPNPPVISQQSLPVTSNLQFQQLQATSVLQQPQQQSFLSQHPQFPHIFILTQQPQSTTNHIIQPTNF